MRIKQMVQRGEGYMDLPKVLISAHGMKLRLGLMIALDKRR